MTSHIAAPEALQLYDTTLSSGGSPADLMRSLDARLQIARLLDHFGMTYIDCGQPADNLADARFVSELAGLGLRYSTPVVRTAVRPVVGAVADADAARALLDSGCEVITLTAWAHDVRVDSGMGASLAEHLESVDRWVRALVAEGRTVFVDCHHYFDGYRANPDYAIEVVRRAAEAGAELVVLNDTNGGMLPTWMGDIVSAAGAIGVDLGVHCANDTGCAVANSLAAIEAGAIHVAGAINGYGSRAGDTDWTSLIPDLQLVLGWSVVAPAKLAGLTHLSRAVADWSNQPHQPRRPYVGESAFEQGIDELPGIPAGHFVQHHHVDPALVGNSPQVLVASAGPFATLASRAARLGFELVDHQTLERIDEVLRERERDGYSYETTDASFELLVRWCLGELPRPFTIEGWRVTIDCDGAGQSHCEAAVKVTASGKSHVVNGRGNGPLNALDEALHVALVPEFSQVSDVKLTDYRVRVLSGGTDARVRTIIDMTDGRRSWSCVGVGTDVIEASQEALSDGYLYGLLGSAAESAPLG